MWRKFLFWITIIRSLKHMTKKFYCQARFLFFCCLSQEASILSDVTEKIGEEKNEREKIFTDNAAVIGILFTQLNSYFT